jgi:hypothetical protein
MPNRVSVLTISISSNSMMRLPSPKLLHAEALGIADRGKAQDAVATGQFDP